MTAPRMVARLIRQCELAKLALSRHESAEVRIPNAEGEFDDSSPRETVTRDEFQRWTDHLVARAELPVRRALGDARLKRTDINDVILVGGATRMPSIINRVTSLFGKPPMRRLNPDEVVALGAGIQAGLIARAASLDDLVVTDVAPFSLGVEVSKHFGLEHRDGYYLPIISRNTTIPVSRVERVSTVYANQTAVKVKIYQGESRHVQDNLLLGEFEVKGIQRGPAGQEVDLRFTYDLNGVLEVEATVVATSKQCTHVVTRHARGLSAEQVAKAIEAMQKLKTHPREETANRFLLRRAERLFSELPVDARTMLGNLLDGFEAALSMGDREAIERHREVLEQFLDQQDPSTDGETEGTGDGAW
jgi:molecular chaperone HscC